MASQFYFANIREQTLEAGLSMINVLTLTSGKISSKSPSLSEYGSWAAGSASLEGQAFHRERLYLAAGQWGS